MKIKYIVNFFNILNWFLAKQVAKDTKQIDKNRQKRKQLKAAIAKVNEDSKQVHRDRQLAERIQRNIEKITE